MLSRLTEGAESTFPTGDLHGRPAHSQAPDTASHAGGSDDPARNRLLGALPPLDRAALLLNGESVILRAGDVLVRPGAAIDHAWFPEGAIVSFTFGGDHEVEAIGCDGMLGTPLLLGVGIAERWGIVRVGGRALRLPAGALREALAERPAVRALLERHLHASLLQLARAVTCGREHLTVPRLATLLLWLRDQRGADDLALTHEQVARLLGVSRRASVTEGLRVLKANGLVGARRGGLHVADAVGLQAMACPCYHAARGQFDRALVA
ncbi:MAG TPA: Crp/Fnr family transcriptional regulator [Gemmatimonadaceae bacterium]